jgi:hypothetical protein
MNKLKILLPFGIFILLWTFIFVKSGIFNVGFNYFLDDHVIVLSHRNYTSFEDIVVKPFADLFIGSTDGRFRPLYDIFIRLLSQVYGLNPFIWYFSSFLVAIITTGLFYIFGRLQKFSVLEAIGFTSLIVFGQQASTYARFGTPETTSTLLLALAFLFGSLNVKNKKNQFIIDYSFVSFSILAALNKEACILMLPALCFFKAWNLSRQENINLKDAFYKNKVNIVSILSIFSLFIAFIKLGNLHGPGYADLSKETFSIQQLISSLKNNKGIVSLAIFTNILYFITLFNRRYDNISFYILTILIIVPQLIIYNKTAIFGHYCLPAAIGVALLAIYPIQQVRRKSIINARISIFVASIVVLQQIIFTQNYFWAVSEKLNSMQSMISGISNCVSSDDKLAIVGNPYLNYEALHSFKIIAPDVIHNNQPLLATIGSQKSHLITSSINSEEEKKWYFLDPKALDKTYDNKIITGLSKQDLSSVKGFVLLDSNRLEKPLLELNLDWFNPDILTHKYYEKMDISVYCKQ